MQGRWRVGAEGALTAKIVGESVPGATGGMCRSFKQRSQCVWTHSNWGGGRSGWGWGLKGKQRVHFTGDFTGPLKSSLVTQMVKGLPAVWEIWVRSLCQEDPLEKEMATHSGTLARRIPWMEELGELQSMGSQRVGHD